MRRSLRLICASSLLLGGCAYLPFNHHRDDYRDGTGFSRKLVVDKRPTSVLVAYDATICMVDAKRYRDVHLRDDVWCNWRREGNGRSVASGSGDVGRGDGVPLAAGAAERVHSRPKPPPRPKKTAKKND